MPVEEPAVPAEPVHRLRQPSVPTDDRTGVRRLEFVPVGEPPEESRPPRKPRSKPAAGPLPPPATSMEPRWSLWGDLEP
jgi:hypothetical protein